MCIIRGNRPEAIEERREKPWVPEAELHSLDGRQKCFFEVFPAAQGPCPRDLTKLLGASGGHSGCYLTGESSETTVQWHCTLGSDMSQSSAWSYLAPCQLLTTCEEPAGQCQALGNSLPSTWTPTSQNSVYLGTIPCPWGIHLSSLTSWDFTPEGLHVLTPRDVMLDSYKHFRYSFLTWAIPKPAAFPSQVTDIGGRHRVRGGQIQ